MRGRLAKTSIMMKKVQEGLKVVSLAPPNSKTKIEKPSFRFLCTEFSKINEIQSKHEKMMELSKFLKTVPEIELKKLSLLILGYLEKGTKLCLQENYILELLMLVYNVQKEAAVHLLKKHKDFGIIAFDLATKRQMELNQPAESVVSCEELYNELQEIFPIHRNKFTKKQCNMLAQIARKLPSPLEQMYFFRILEGNLKIGCKIDTLEEAIVQSAPTFTQFNLERITLQEQLKSLPKMTNIFGSVIELIKAQFVQNDTEAQQFIQTNFGPQAVCEIFYDGIRSRLHYKTGKLNIVKDNEIVLNNKFKNHAKNLLQFFSNTNIGSCIIDTDLIFLNEFGRILAINELGSKSVTGIPKTMAFDILMLNEHNISFFPLLKRKAILASIIKEGSDFLEKTEYHKINASSFKRDPKFNEMSQISKEITCKGILIKNANENNSQYKVSKPSQWIAIRKVPPEMPHSINLVPIAGLESKSDMVFEYLLAAYDKNKKVFSPVCTLIINNRKFKTSLLQNSLRGCLTKKKPENIFIPPPFQPLFYINPSCIWKIRAQSFTLSSDFDIATEKYGRGITLRYAELLEVNKKLNPEEASSTAQIIELYQKFMSS